jgi:single-stranded DNA-binding protein
MSDINPKDYEGASVVIVGSAGGPVEVVKFPNGGSQAQLSIAVGKGYKKGDEWVDTGTDWYTLTATEDYAAQNWPDVQTGDKVRVDEARQELKGYIKKDGEAGVDARLRYGTLVIVSSKASRQSGSTGVKPF